MILLRRGRTEGRHDGVADELLDRSAGVGDLGRHRVVEPVEQGARSLRVLGSRELRGAHQVGEEDRRKLPLFARLGRLEDRVGAARAEASIRGNGLAAVRAERHVAIIPRRRCTDVAPDHVVTPEACATRSSVGAPGIEPGTSRV